MKCISQHRHCTVWLAEHRALHQTRIIKGIPQTDLCHDRLVREADFLKNLDHPGIPKILDVDRDGDYTYIIEQYIEGESLKSLYLRRAVSEQQLLDHLGQISSILRYLHDSKVGVLHLDLKPENIIVSDRIYLLDFGSAAYDGEEGIPLFATKKYCAPERKLSSKPGKEADIYSLGKLIVFMVDNSVVAATTRKRILGIADRCCPGRIRCRIGSDDIVIRMLEKVTEKKHACRNFGKNGLRGKKIAVLGLHRGCGTTHVAIALANYLAREFGSRTIYMEENNHDDIRFLFAEGAAHEYGNVAYRRFDRKDEDSDVSGDETVVVDLGGDPTRVMSEALESDLLILVGGGAPWRRKDYYFPQRMKLSGEEASRTVILINQGNPQTIGELSTKEYRTYVFPYESNPLRPGPETIKIFGKMVCES